MTSIDDLKNWLSLEVTESYILGKYGVIGKFFIITLNEKKIARYKVVWFG